MKKRFPPYGKKLMQLRNQGKIPNKLLMVVFDWMIARAYPRIVITEETLPKETEFKYLSESKGMQVTYTNATILPLTTFNNVELNLYSCWIESSHECFTIKIYPN